MFGFFKKKALHKRLDDRIYISRAVANAAFIHHAKERLAVSSDVFLLCFFEASIEALNKLAPDLKILKAEKLANDLATRSAVKGKYAPVFLFAEHHPSFTEEAAVVAAIEEIYPGGEAAVGFYGGLDDPLMQRFGSDKIIDLMKKMGMKDDEAISHSMVTSSIKRAQEKISAKAGSIKTHSQQEWMNVNLGS